MFNMNNLLRYLFFTLFYMSLLCYSQSLNSSQILPNLQDFSKSNDEKESQFYSLYGSVAPLTDSLAEDAATTEVEKITAVPEVTSVLNTMFQDNDEPEIIVPSIKDFAPISAKPVKPKKITPAVQVAKIENFKKTSKPPPTPKPVEIIVNINKADIPELMDNLGLDYFRAKSIVEYRTANGNFKSIDELDNVFGITDDLFITLLPKIKI